jgi:hypothetical protein
MEDGAVCGGHMGPSDELDDLAQHVEVSECISAAFESFGRSSAATATVRLTWPSAKDSRRSMVADPLSLLTQTKTRTCNPSTHIVHPVGPAC